MYERFQRVSYYSIMRTFFRFDIESYISIAYIQRNMVVRHFLRIYYVVTR